MGHPTFYGLGVRSLWLSVLIRSSPLGSTHHRICTKQVYLLFPIQEG